MWTPTRVPRRSSQAFSGLIAALFLILPRAYGADTYDIVVSGGKDVNYTYTDPQGKQYPFKMQAWHRLLAFHTFLRKELGVAEGAALQSADVGCVDEVCKEFEPTSVEGQPGALPPYDPPASVTYRVYKTTWDGAGSLKGIFAAAEKSIADADSLKDGDFDVADPIETPEESTCIPPYQPPCYDRPVCTLYAGCSRSSTSCVKCIK